MKTVVLILLYYRKLFKETSNIFKQNDTPRPPHFLLTLFFDFWKKIAGPLLKPNTLFISTSTTYPRYSCYPFSLMHRLRP